MKRRELLKGCASGVALVLIMGISPVSRSQTTVTVGISVSQARELAVAQRMTGLSGLPPGIRRNLARGKPLPPGIARRNLPDGMVRGLPVVQGHEWRVAGTDLVLVALGTLIVAEILQDVFR